MGVDIFARISKEYSFLLDSSFLSVLIFYLNPEPSVGGLLLDFLRESCANQLVVRLPSQSGLIGLVWAFGLLNTVFYRCLDGGEHVLAYFNIIRDVSDF